MLFDPASEQYFLVKARGSKWDVYEGPENDLRSVSTHHVDFHCGAVVAYLTDGRLIHIPQGILASKHSSADLLITRWETNQEQYARYARELNAASSTDNRMLFMDPEAPADRPDEPADYDIDILKETSTRAPAEITRLILVEHQYA